MILGWWLTTSAATTLTEVGISNNYIGVDGAQALAAAVPGSALRCIVAGTFCSGVREGATTGVADLVFGSHIPVNDPEVTELDYRGQGLGPAEAMLVAAAISTNAALTEVDLSSNPIGFSSSVSLRP